MILIDIPPAELKKVIGLIRRCIASQADTWRCQREIETLIGEDFDDMTDEIQSAAISLDDPRDAYAIEQHEIENILSAWLAKPEGDLEDGSH